MLQPLDVVVISGLALLVFGPKRLPEFSRSLGRSMAEFKKGVSDVAREAQEASRVDAAKPAEAQEASRVDAAKPAEAAKPDEAAKPAESIETRAGSPSA